MTNIEKAKLYLLQAKTSEAKVRMLKNRLKQLKIQKSYMHSMYSEDAQKLMWEIEDLEEQASRQITAYERQRKVIADSIERLDNADYVTILSAKYLDGETLEVISEDMDYSFDWIRHKVGKAVEAYYNANADAIEAFVGRTA